MPNSAEVGEKRLRFPATLADAFLEVAPCEKWRDLPYSEGKNIDLTDYGSEGYRFNSCQVRHLFADALF